MTYPKADQAVIDAAAIYDRADAMQSAADSEADWLAAQLASPHDAAFTTKVRPVWSCVAAQVREVPLADEFVAWMFETEKALQDRNIVALTFRRGHRDLFREFANAYAAEMLRAGSFDDADWQAGGL